ncbi:enoyl-CoA hydratase-related protein [Nocardioides sp.]|uniref:enoyl-CoA hydratase-related protein n=1 Tax=Nocardioides sp. TaxID=35761 RepID=UPI003D09E7FD
MSDGNPVRYEKLGNVALLTLDRPEALNAFTDAMEQALIECFKRTDADDEVRVVVLTGAGKAFCAGMDLTPSPSGLEPFEEWRASTTAPAGTQFEVAGQALPVRRDGGGRVVLRIFDSTKPVIAAINGHAVGVGITMTLPCDLRIMAAEAKVAFPFVRRGFVPESCSSWFLPRVVPMQRAMEWMLTGRTLTSSEVLEAGLVLSVHPADEVLDVAMALARRISQDAAPVSTSVTRRLLWQMQTATHPMAAHQLETQALNLRGVSADASEGVAAFLARRPPEFTDRLSEVPEVFDAARATYSPPASLPPNS